MILAVDGGGTKTAAIIVDEDSGKLIGTGVSGPSNVRSVTAVTSRKNILKAIKNAEKMAGMVQISDSIYGIAGYGDSIAATAEINSIIESIDKLSPANPVITNDGEAAAYLITMGNDGIVTAVGTGSVGAYIKDGVLHRVGGWSYLTDDAASGYWIARKGLEMAEKSYDGFIEKTTLIQKFEDYFKLPLRDLVADMESHFNKRIMASLAMIVDRAASEGDRISNEVLELAAGEIEIMIDGMKTKFDVPVNTGCIGGVMQSSKIRGLLTDKYENLKVFYGYHVAIGNAMRLMNKRDEHTRDSLVSQLDDTIPKLSRTEKDLLFIK
ncbi:BadF/BadG/BcrA/BcrD ATPase family protein [Ferroplasma sp.]|uniref:BadF/BadG/BcrA/BcrD ATPase family protein n=1 Tax=Ferroplasma sp. TaxID=2591003 RepID=UPI002637ED0F|nr:BadF/BadG/BcrA/BcrD ATPase family protein [Ferroplasma sp.]MCL4453665.1 N-acetylglucosamine kinase [Candidatus Thermoplasmatota archaeon]